MDSKDGFKSATLSRDKVSVRSQANSRDKCDKFSNLKL